MAWTKYGWNIDIASLLATYNSDIDLNWKTGGVAIADRGKFSGYVSFNYKRNVAGYITYGFYLNIEPAEQFAQYTFISEMAYAPTDWTAAYKYMPERPFSSFGLASGRTIDTVKEVWIGNVNLGRRYTVEEWASGDKGLMAAPYGIYFVNGVWQNVRTGESHIWDEYGWQGEVDFINKFAHWSHNQDITLNEWKNCGNWYPDQHAIRQAIASRYGILWMNTFWWDTKSALADNRMYDFTDENLVPWLNAHKLVSDMRIAADGDVDVYMIAVPDISWINIISAVPQTA